MEHTHFPTAESRLYPTALTDALVPPLEDYQDVEWTPVVRENELLNWNLADPTPPFESDDDNEEENQTNKEEGEEEDDDDDDDDDEEEEEEEERNARRRKCI